jgi:hypothetical protein
VVVGWRLDEEVLVAAVLLVQAEMPKRGEPMVQDSI